MNNKFEQPNNITRHKSKVELSEYVEVNGIKYYVDNKRIVFEPTKKEIITAVWLSKKINKKVEILPRIKQPEGIKSPDYKIGTENWDLKEIISNRKDAVYNRIRTRKDQANHFIIDISKSKLTIKSATNQVKSIYQNKNLRWVSKIIIKKNDEIEFVNRN